MSSAGRALRRPRTPATASGIIKPLLGVVIAAGILYVAVEAAGGRNLLDEGLRAVGGADIGTALTSIGLTMSTVSGDLEIREYCRSEHSNELAWHFRNQTVDVPFYTACPGSGWLERFHGERGPGDRMPVGWHGGLLGPRMRLSTPVRALLRRGPPGCVPRHAWLPLCTSTGRQPAHSTGPILPPPPFFDLRARPVCAPHGGGHRVQQGLLLRPRFLPLGPGAGLRPKHASHQAPRGTLRHLRRLQ